MAINDQAFRSYFSDRPDEAKLAARLDEAFDITFGKTQGEKAFWIAAPKKHTRERFGLAQEILVIFSAHAKTDARVLTAIENISRNPDFKHRLDRVLYLLVHAGDQADAENLVATDPDRVIVPFSAAELDSSSRGTLFVRSRIAEHFGQIDLFGMSSPITSDRYFFGREQLVQELVIRSTTSAQNSGLFGLRKTGKTSVLRAFERRVDNYNTLTEYIDCHSPGIHSGRWWQVLENIAERLKKRLKFHFKRNADLTLEYDSNNASTRFSSDIQTLIASGSLTRIAILLDEVEYITPTISGALGQHWDSDFLPFWQTIRAAHQESKGQLVFIIAGVNPAALETPTFNSITNPIFQIAPAIYLEPFERSSVRQMVRTLGKYAGVKFDEKVYDYLTDTFGGHPYLIRIACSELWRTKYTADPEKAIFIEIEDFEAIRNQISARLSQPIRDILLSLVWWYPEEYQLLQILAEGDKDFVKDYVEQSEEKLIKFARYGILKLENSAEFAIGDVKEFLNSHGEGYQKEITPFMRSDMPPELLPEVPDKATLALLFEKRVEVETKLRRTIIFYFGVHYNWDNKTISKALSDGLKKRSDRPDPAALFVGTTPQKVMNELYFLDLREIILYNWNVFSALFENKKKWFTMNMDTINTARRVDAHTKPVSPEEIDEFNNAYGWVMRHLSKLPDQI
ncbi:AAA-like domain-containing protein [Salinisphaera sp.]|uniref:AAA family ATPase n=1 Tax=Salinisphaera sp. TaxID=1914330 RepID=UPI000C63BFBB|nr:AAA-like domain-containing protein [Salinisphaera sp.]MBS62103.1 hypothetical protein [Salinisphaera sp.]